MQMKRWWGPVFAGLLTFSTGIALADPPGGLPPGLQKKVAAGQPLPPGWQKKLHPGAILDRDIYNRGVIVVPRNSDGVVVIRVENETIRLIAATLEIIDVLSH